MNNSTHTSDQLASCPYVSAFFTTTMATVSLAAVIGNILIIGAVYRTPSLRTSTNYYYVNMAVSDFICSITTWPLYLTDEIITSSGSLIQGPLATAGCKVGVFSRMVSHSVSILSLLLIAVDRLIAIAFPLKATLLTRKLRASLLCATWLISLTFNIPDLYFSRVEKVGELTSCIFTWHGVGAMIYYLVAIVIFNVTPIVTVMVIYFRIMRALRRRLKPECLEKKDSDFKQRRMRQNQNIMKIFISIVAALVVCFTFFSLYMVLKVPFHDFFLKDKCKVSLGFCYFVLPLLSTMINPVILGAYSANFRRGMLKLCQFSLDKCHCKVKRVSAYRADDSLPELVTFRHTVSY